MFCRPTGRFSFEWGWFSSAGFSGIHPHTTRAPEEQKKETQCSVRARGGLLLESSLFFQTTGESTEREQAPRQKPNLAARFFHRAAPRAGTAEGPLHQGAPAHDAPQGKANPQPRG